MANCYLILLTLSSLAVACTAQSSYGGGSGSCGPAVPSNIRVWAIPDSLYVAGPPASGFLVGLLNALQGVTGIPYTLAAHPELSFGNQDASGSFNGSLIGALVQNQADLVGTDVTITSSREAAADFLVPFSQYQLQIVANTQFGLGSSVQYICQDDADLQFLKNSKNATINAIYDNINAGRPGSIVADNDDAGAVAKVATGNFAYVGESVQIAKALAASSAKNLAVQGGSLGTFYLALAVQQGSALRDVLNSAMLKLAESGALQTLLTAAGLQ